MPDDAPLTAATITEAGFYLCTSVAHAIVPPALLKDAVADAGVGMEDDVFFHFEVRPVCQNHILRIRPVPKAHFEVGNPQEHSRMKLVSRTLDKVAITSAQYGQVHIYFQGIPVILCSWRYGPIVYIRRQLTDWALLTPDERRVLRDMSVQTGCPVTLG